jgi:hypothetical protein
MIISSLMCLARKTQRIEHLQPFQTSTRMFNARVRLRTTRGEFVNSDPELWQKDEWQKYGVEKSSEFLPSTDFLKVNI